MNFDNQFKTLALSNILTLNDKVIEQKKCKYKLPMKNYLIVGLLLIFCNQISAQISYQSPLGFSLNFNSTSSVFLIGPNGIDL